MAAQVEINCDMFEGAGEAVDEEREHLLASFVLQRRRKTQLNRGLFQKGKSSREKKDVRGAQFKSATPRALTAQHSGVSGVPGQRIERLPLVGTPMVMVAPKRAVAMIVEKCIVDGGRGAARILKRLVGDCDLLLKTREVQALMFEWKRRVGLRDSYRHLLTAVRLQIVLHKGVVGDISNQALRPCNVTMRAKSVGQIFLYYKK